MKVDIAIIGGGVAGCTAAIALAPFYNITLIDKSEQPKERIGECLAPASRRILAQLNLLDDLEKAILPANGSRHLRNMGTRSYWGSEQLQVADHLRNPDGFGWHLDRQAFEKYLREKAAQQGINCLWPARLQDAVYKDGFWELAVSVPDNAKPVTRHLSARFVIDASGRQSHFARKLGIQRQHFDKLIACWATMPNHAVNQMSTISAGEYGWWYSAPLPENKRVMALQTDSDLIRHGTLKNAAQFLELALCNREMAQLVERDARYIRFHRTVAANSTRLCQVAGQQWAALGDAAISFDPLSAQGMFNAMAGAVQLAELLQNHDVIGKTDTSAFETAYAEQTEQIWEHYLKHKQIFYGVEKRWCEAVFWKRRHAQAAFSYEE